MKDVWQFLKPWWPLLVIVQGLWTATVFALNGRTW